jgi:broad-specificity NMP kinase
MMYNVCPQCGLYRADKIIDPEGPYAICPECGARQPFKRLPLLVVGGASGSGKSTACHHLIRTGLPDVVLLDSDILWAPVFDKPKEGYQSFFETWLRLCKNINQSGRPVTLFGAGLGVPENLETCTERRYFSGIHYLALVCGESELRHRLEERPAWRGNRSPAFLDSQAQFNEWFKAYTGHPPIQRLDTTNAEPEETARRVARWIHAVLEELPHEGMEDPPQER